MKVLVLGVGAVGARAARYLVAHDDVSSVLIADANARRRAVVASSLGARARTLDSPDDVAGARADVVLIATPAAAQPDAARQAVAQGRHVVATADSIPAVRALLDLDAEARERGVTVAIGATFSPGLSCVLARHAASQFDSVDEVHVARQGTGGPACARQHHGALRGRGIDWRDQGWTRRPPGSGRELSFFPDPIGGADCYRAALPDALLLVPAFAGVSRVTARLAATRRDRFTAGLPMLRRPHPEGRIGGLRVEVRGRRGQLHDTVVLGAIDRPAVAAATVAGLATRWVGSGRTEPGAQGLACLVDALPFLHDLSEAGVRAAVFEGAAAG
ncbi:MAG TPA: Gfo/Idh/MocA family oxidoreductase [Acidimicrobiales bacterium]|nr:Gfo/Idh/MocA family oxidoreductase [Acidimicrobiales bacterium]